MGQRLCLNIHIAGVEDPILNVYMHWSAYTGATIEVIDSLINQWHEMLEDIPMKDLYDNHKLKDYLCMAMIKAWPGALPQSSEDGDNEVDDIKLRLLGEKMFQSIRFLDAKTKESFDRSRGLIGFTEDSMAGNSDAAEETSDIYMNESTFRMNEISFGVMCMVPEADWFDDCKDRDGPEAEAECEKRLLRFEDNADAYDRYINDGIIDIDDWGWFKDLYETARSVGKYCVAPSKSLVTDIGDRYVLEFIE